MPTHDRLWVFSVRPPRQVQVPGSARGLALAVASCTEAEVEKAAEERRRVCLDLSIRPQPGQRVLPIRVLPLLVIIFHLFLLFFIIFHHFFII